MLNILNQQRDIRNFILQRADQLDVFRRCSVAFGEGMTKNGAILAAHTWCMESLEEITLFPSSIRIGEVKPGATEFKEFKDKYCMFVFETEETAMAFRIAFSECVLDIWKVSAND